MNVPRRVLVMWNDAKISPASRGLLAQLARQADVVVAAPDALPIPTLDEAEEALLTLALERCHGNRTHAARLLDINLRTLRNRLRAYGGIAPAPPGRPISAPP